MAENYVTNPVSGRPVRIGSVVYQRLIKKGLIGQTENISKAYKELPQQIAQKTKKKQIIPVQQELEEEYDDYEEIQETQQQYITQQKGGIPYNIKNPQKIKKPLEIKINSILDSGVEAYKRSIRNIPENLTEEQLDLFIRNDLIKNLKATNNKYIQKYL